MSDPVVDVILEKVRLALRYVDSTLDTEITDVIAAAKLDLKRVGVDVPLSDTDIDEQMLIAIILYARWQFDFENDGNRYKAMYFDKRADLALCGDYNEE
jgi:hypothetical protein